MKRRRQLHCMSVMMLVVVMVSFVPRPAEARIWYKRHVLSWESLMQPKRLAHLKAFRSLRRFELEPRRTVKLDRTGFRRSYQFATPLVVEGSLYVGVDAGKIYAIDLQPIPKKRWMVKTEGGIHIQPAFDRGVVYIGDLEGFVYAFDATTGTERWRAKLDDEVTAALLVAGDMLYATTASGRVFALTVSTGDERWHSDPREKGWGFSVHGAARPVLFGNMIIVGHADGTLVAYSKNDGTVRWTTLLGDRRERVFDVDATSLIEEGKLFTVTADGSVVCLNPRSGVIVWQTHVEGANDLRLANGKLFITGSGLLTALDIREGSQLWQQDFETPDISAATGKDYLAVISTVDRLFLTDPANGDVMFFRYVRTGAFGHPVVVNDEFYLLANSARLFGYQVKELPPRKLRVAR